MAMLLYMLGNLLAGFSRSIIELIVFRGIAGAGGGAVVGISQIVVSDLVSLRERWAALTGILYMARFNGVVLEGSTRDSSAVLLRLATRLGRSLAVHSLRKSAGGYVSRGSRDVGVTCS